MVYNSEVETIYANDDSEIKREINKRLHCCVDRIIAAQLILEGKEKYKGKDTNKYRLFLVLQE
jgi:hypothetical protein